MNNTENTYKKRIKQLEKQVQRLQLNLARKHAEDPSEINQIYKQLVNYLSDYIYTVRVSGGEVMETIHGPGCTAVTGYRPEDYVNEPELWYSMVYRADREIVTEQSSRALKGEDVQPLEHRIVHRDGSVRWVRNTIVLLKNKKGTLYAYNGLINDITAQKEAEHELLESEEKYRSLTDDVLESSRVGISILNADLRVVWVNKAYSDYLGINREQVLKQDARALVAECMQGIIENAQEFQKRVLSSYKNNSTIERLECRIKKSKNVQGRWLEYWSKPINTGLYKGGRIEHFTDITEQKRILDEVTESERRNSQLLFHLTDYIYSVKVKHDKPVYTYHGQGSLAVTGYTQEDFAINPELWIEMVYPEDRPLVREHAQNALLGQALAPLEHRIIQKSGELKWVKSTIVHQKDEQGRVISYDGLISDITELKEAEERDRLTQQQLIQADKMATLGILVSGVAHEINNPNNFIKLNTQMIDKTWSSAKPVLDQYFEENGDFVLAGMPYSSAKDKIRSLIGGISKGSARIENIVSGLKDYAKQDPGDMDQNIDLNKVVKAAILIVNNLIKKSTDSFKVDFWKKLPMVQGNFQNLEQVLINLITNSCQALNESPKNITIKTIFDSYKNQVKIQVSDTGDGINEQQMKHIFDPFYTTKRGSGGTGLGLSIAYNIVQNHRGDLQFESKKTGGTTATLTLPVFE